MIGEGGGTRGPSVKLLKKKWRVKSHAISKLHHAEFVHLRRSGAEAGVSWEEGGGKWVSNLTPDLNSLTTN